MEGFFHGQPAPRRMRRHGQTRWFHEKIGWYATSRGWSGFRLQFTQPLLLGTSTVDAASRNSCCRLVAAAILTLLTTVGRGDDSLEPSAGISPEIAQSIADLASVDYARRESASRALATAGASAIQPLLNAIEASDDLEVRTRGIEILQVFLIAEDPQVAEEAERVLERLSSHDDLAASRMALATLEFHNVALADESQFKLEALGGRIETTMLADGRIGLHVTLNEDWTGTPDDLRLVSRLPQVLHLSIHGVRLDDQSVKHLTRLRRVDQLALFNTSLSDEAAARLAAALPDTTVDIRRGGKLGVGGQPLVVPCIITQVQPGSAADNAGIRVGDVIQSFDGEQVESFEDLTNKIGSRAPGEKIEVGVERGGRVFEKTLALDGWQ
jgi:hypothetical protein